MKPSKFYALSIGDTIAPRKHPDNHYEVVGFTPRGRDVHVTLERSLSVGTITRTMGQLVKNWRQVK